MKYKTVVLTGASSGIGLAILKELSKETIKIIAVGRNKTKLESAIRSIDSKLLKSTIYPYACDVSDSKEIDKLFIHAKKLLINIDLFIANAGFAYYERLSKPDWVHIKKIFDTDVLSPFYSVQKMAEQKTDHMVVITASAMARLPMAGYALYSAAKSSIDAFANAYRFEMPKHQKLLILYPVATTNTDFFKNANAPVPFGSQKAEVIAASLIHGIRKNKQEVIPFSFKLLSFFDRFLPVKKIFQKIDAKNLK